MLRQAGATRNLQPGLLKLPAEFPHDTLLMPRQGLGVLQQPLLVLLRIRALPVDDTFGALHVLLDKLINLGLHAKRRVLSDCSTIAFHGRSLPQVARNDFQHEHGHRPASLLPRTGNGLPQPLAP